jgi:uncharacterized protein YjbI with pentapeptide repeats
VTQHAPRRRLCLSVAKLITPLPPSSPQGARFNNAVLSGTSFVNADVEDADFTDAYLGEFDQKTLCRNPTLKGENPVTGAPTKLSAGCK